MGILQNYVNNEQTDRQEMQVLAKLKYTGKLKHLSGKSGTGYYIASEDRWYFTPNNDNNVYRVKAENLDFMR
jgi:hypothetical protein